MRSKLLMLMLIIISTFVSYGQKNTIQPDVKYRRSSLHLILLESDDFPRKATVIDAYNNAPFPDKYNNHSLISKSFAPNNYPISDDERTASGVKKNALGGALSNAESSATAGIVDKNESDMPLIIQKYITDKKIANQLVAKWFDRADDGSFDMNMISERGQYNATEMEANIAKGSTRGVSLLSDAGEELIKNTFVVFTKLKFVNNEIVAKAIKDAVEEEVKKKSLPSFMMKGVQKGIDAAYNKGKEGYSVWTSAYLYRLKWNDSISSIFYNNYWINKGKMDMQRKSMFDTTGLFQLESVGEANATSLVIFSLKETRTEDQIVNIATTRNVDAVFAKLQKKYDVFKPKVPLYTGYPITAKIGMKEGLEGGEMFEVLEQSINEKTGLTEYKSKGKIEVDKKLVWDNRYAAIDTPQKTDSTNSVANPAITIDRTTFSGGKKYYSGMLIRQIK